MPQLPDKKRAFLIRPARDFLSSVTRVAAMAAWRTLHPAARERFVEAPAPKPLTRLYYETEDGWRAPLFFLPPAPGGAGEPVILAHTLGIGADAFRYGAGPSLAHRLSAAGFAVYLLTHRGDTEAINPGNRDFSFDDIVEQDVPAAIDRVRRHAWYPRVHWVGHGLGGQLGLVWAGVSRSWGVATVTALCSAVEFHADRVGARRAAIASRLLPAHWPMPARTLARLVAPLIDEHSELQHHTLPGVSPPPRLRGVLNYAVEDVPVGLVRQICQWLKAGTLTSKGGLLDYREVLSDAKCPLLAVVAEEDRVCPPEWATPAAARWGASDKAVLRVPGMGHLDPLMAEVASEEVFEPIAAWLQSRRRLAWERDGEPSLVTGYRMKRSA